MNSESETTLLSRLVRHGDAGALAQITRSYAGMVYGTCLRITGNQEEAADAAQETFFELVKHAGQVTSSLGGWLHRVAIRRATDLIRRDISRREREHAYAAESAPATDRWADLSPLVDETMNELEDESRELLIQHFLQGQTMIQIAAARGISQSTVSRRVEHALARLREHLRNKGVVVALPVLAALMPSTTQAAPATLLAELGKMSLATAGTAAGAAATRMALPTGTGSKVTLIAATVVAVVGLGGFLVHQYNLNRKPSPPRSSAAPTLPRLAQTDNSSRTAPRRVPTGGVPTTPPAAGAADGPARIGNQGSPPAVALGFGGAGAIPAAVASSEPVDRGRTFGNDGDWRRAFECFREEIAAGRTSDWSESEWAWATSAALAAGETNVCREWCRQLLERLGDRENPDTAERCAKLCLALPGISGDLLAKAVERADFAIADNPELRFRQLAKGMAEYRQGNWSNALEWLRRPERSSQFDLAMQAWAFGAMARHHLGDAAGARTALDGLHRRVQALIHTGELGDRSRVTWDNCARAVALRAEAERLILGREVSPPIDPSVTGGQRRKWQAVMQLLRGAEQLAGKERWAEARDAYARALADPGFDWDPFLYRVTLVSQHVAAAFLMAGDETRHRDLCGALLERPAGTLPRTMQERNAWVYLVRMDHLPPDLKTRALAAVRETSQAAETENNAWIWLITGLAACREGRPDDALFALDHAMFGGDVMAIARLSVIRAMACQQAGQTNEATAALEEAESFFARKTPQNSGWWNDSFYHLTLRELRAMRGAADVPPNRL